MVWARDQKKGYRTENILYGEKALFSSIWLERISALMYRKSPSDGFG
jgi:hypothetical protein